jgi:hypothetical protein
VVCASVCDCGGGAMSATVDGPRATGGGGGGGGGGRVTGDG